MRNGYADDGKHQPDSDANDERPGGRRTTMMLRAPDPMAPFLLGPGRRVAERPTMGAQTKLSMTRKR